MKLRFQFKMFGKPVPADLDWGIVGEWCEGVDYQKMAHRIFDSLSGHYPLQRVVILRDDEQIACWSPFEDIKAQYRETESIQRSFDQVLARYRDG